MQILVAADEEEESKLIQTLAQEETPLHVAARATLYTADTEATFRNVALLCRWLGKTGGCEAQSSQGLTPSDIARLCGNANGLAAITAVTSTNRPKDGLALLRAVERAPRTPSTTKPHAACFAGLLEEALIAARAAAMATHPTPSESPTTDLKSRGRRSKPSLPSSSSAPARAAKAHTNDSQKSLSCPTGTASIHVMRSPVPYRPAIRADVTLPAAPASPYMHDSCSLSPIVFYSPDQMMEVRSPFSLRDAQCGPAESTPKRRILVGETMSPLPLQRKDRAPDDSAIEKSSKSESCGAREYDSIFAGCSLEVYSQDSSLPGLSPLVRPLRAHNSPRRPLRHFSFSHQFGDRRRFGAQQVCALQRLGPSKWKPQSGASNVIWLQDYCCELFLTLSDKARRIQLCSC